MTVVVHLTSAFPIEHGEITGLVILMISLPAVPVATSPWVTKDEHCRSVCPSCLACAWYSVNIAIYQPHLGQNTCLRNSVTDNLPDRKPTCGWYLAWWLRHQAGTLASPVDIQDCLQVRLFLTRTWGVNRWSFMQSHLCHQVGDQGARPPSMGELSLA